MRYLDFIDSKDVVGYLSFNFCEVSCTHRLNGVQLIFETLVQLIIHFGEAPAKAVIGLFQSGRLRIKTASNTLKPLINYIIQFVLDLLQLLRQQLNVLVYLLLGIVLFFNQFCELLIHYSVGVCIIVVSFLLNLIANRVEIFPIGLSHIEHFVNILNVRIMGLEMIGLLIKYLVNLIFVLLKSLIIPLKMRVHLIELILGLLDVAFAPLVHFHHFFLQFFNMLL